MRFVVSISFLLVWLAYAAKGQGYEEKEELNYYYTPSIGEQYVIATRNYNNSSSGCVIWNQDSTLRGDLQVWKQELYQYNEQLKKKTEGTYFAPDLRTIFHDNDSNREAVCHEYADPPPTATASSLVATTSVSQQLGKSSSSSDMMLPSVFSSSSDPKTVEPKKSPSRLRGRNLDTRFLGTHYNIPSQKSTLGEYFFQQSILQLSYLPRQGYMEPLLPPLRHPDMCTPTVCTSKPCPLGSTHGDHVDDRDYLIEDFGHICRHILKKHIRTIFIDMAFNTASTKALDAIQNVEKYRRFGIHFDHIYAYEAPNKKAQDVYKTVPPHMLGPLHWINTPISPEEGHRNNPWTMLLETYQPEDFVVVKLDIDTPSVETPLFQQLLANPQLQKLVDVFYFEHHVQMDEMQIFWGEHSSGHTKGSITESLKLFQSLRKAGVAAHYWV